MTPAVALEDLAVRFVANGTTVPVLEATDLTVAPGEFLCVVGPTGCGKSTLLNVVAGLLQPAAGSVRIFGRPLSGLNREAGYLFQSDALLPWRSAQENVALGLAFRGESRRAAAVAANGWLARVGLKDAAARYPHQLSGGMKKRVALAQVLALNPKILLMDEPFSALDVQTRSLMENELLSLWSADRKSVIFITHDLEEAIALGDRVIVMSAGPASRPVGEYPIDLPRPRDVAEIRMTPRFVELQRQIWQTLRAQVLPPQAFGQGPG
jgi:NitT/TauT family transport system ATP-binding protein